MTGHRTPNLDLLPALVTKLRTGVKFGLAIRTRLLFLLGAAFVTEFRIGLQRSATFHAGNFFRGDGHLRSTFVAELRVRCIRATALRTRNATRRAFAS